MEVQNAINARRSIRRYARRAIPNDVLAELLEAARLAPSSSNLQAYNIVVVTDDETKLRLVPASGNQSFVGQCSAYLVGVTETEYHAIDVSIAFDHISLRALEFGLGTCWIGDFDSEMVKKTLGIPERLLVPICMTLGYPSLVPNARKRKPISDILFLNKWGTKWP